MINHASIGASDPQSTAATLARLFRGKLLRLPNQYQTFSVRMKDGSMIEVWPSDKGFEADTDLHHVSIRPLPQYLSAVKALEKAPEPRYEGADRSRACLIERAVAVSIDQRVSKGRFRPHDQSLLIHFAFQIRISCSGTRVLMFIT